MGRVRGALICQLCVIVKSMTVLLVISITNIEILLQWLQAALLSAGSFYPMSGVVREECPVQQHRSVSAIYWGWLLDTLSQLSNSRRVSKWNKIWQFWIDLWDMSADYTARASGYKGLSAELDTCLKGYKKLALLPSLPCCPSLTPSSGSTFCPVKLSEGGSRHHPRSATAHSAKCWSHPR
jgi:hypothetical protein